MRLKKYKKKLSLILVLIILFLITLVFISKKITSYNLINLNLPKYLCFEEVSVNQELKTDIYFNNQFGEKTFSKKILSNIQQAEKSIEIAMYSFNVEKIKQALYQAAKEKIEITIILDQERKQSQHDFVFSNLPSGITRINIETDNGLMHHKFMIIDRGEKNEKLITQSLNWTDWQEEFDPSYLLETTDQEIIKTFGEEFDRLKNKVSGIKKFKEKKYFPWIKRINYQNCFVDIWFSPGIKTNSINQRIIDLIGSAKNNIKIMSWQITDFNIINAILKQANNGIDVKIITDDYNFWKKDSTIKYLVNQNPNLTLVDDAWHTLNLKNEIPEIIEGEIFNSFFHHHALIIDNEKVLFGTNNWSAQANYNNDENIIITDNSKLVSEFLNTFDYFFNKLRNKNLLAEIKKDTLFLDSSQNFENKNIVAIASQDISLSNNHLICWQKKIDHTYQFNIPDICQNLPLSIFIYNNDLEVIAGNIIQPEK